MITAIEWNKHEHEFKYKRGEDKLFYDVILITLRFWIPNKMLQRDNTNI